MYTALRGYFCPSPLQALSYEVSTDCHLSHFCTLTCLSYESSTEIYSSHAGNTMMRGSDLRRRPVQKDSRIDLQVSALLAD